MGAARKKRRVGSSASPSRRKKHKRLDAIVDRPIPPSPLGAPCAHDTDDPAPRRSARPRRAPLVLDASPVRSPKKTNRPGGSPAVRAVVVSRKSKKIKKKKKKGGNGEAGKMQSARRTLNLTGDDVRTGDHEGGSVEPKEEWGSRLRSRTLSLKNDGLTSAGVACGKLIHADAEIDPESDANRAQVTTSRQDGLPSLEEVEKPSEFPAGQASGLSPQISRSGNRKKSKKKKKKKTVKKKQVKDEEKDQTPILIDDKEQDSRKTELDQNSKEPYISGNFSPTSLSNPVSDHVTTAERAFDNETLAVAPGQGQKIENDSENADEFVDHCRGDTCLEEARTCHDDHVVEENHGNSPHERNIAASPLRKQPVAGTVSTNGLDAPTSTKEVNAKPSFSRDLFDQPDVGEGRRCGLCGRGLDGKPPKRLLQEWADSENEVYHGLSGFEEPKYNELDGFGTEPEWLGQLLGPIRDHFGIARVWVHQQCAVWSPEVYFAGLGCLKSVRAALSRGKALKCCQCERSGATIGCRIDRCPKTYHLPCARADNCVFDHRKFLIACSDHRHLFQPQGRSYSNHLRKLKAKKRKLDMRKQSNEAYRKDLEAEDRWLENCGEDEEFLKRESKRLHRDLIRIAPVYIGGSSENIPSFQGWESVAGHQDVIQCLKEVVILPLLYPDVFDSLGLTPPRGVLLHGYPGTGKTLVVRSLIGECSRGNKRIAYFARKGADCLGKYVGDAERQLRLLFQVAEKSQPSIIFFDEIDGLAPCRSKRQDQTHSSVVSTLLSLLDGLKSRGSVIVIGATNRPEALDPALRRPGRFDREIYFPLPSLNDRAAILSLHTKFWPKPLLEPMLSWIAKQSVGYAGADLQALCTQAAIIALKRNCPLQNILSSAAKGFDVGKHPSLPSFVVEERDWITALAQAPPPCSRREADAAASDVVSSPLPFHLLPNLIQPLSQLLVSFALEERLWLPKALFMAGKHIKSVLFSSLEQEVLPHVSWMSHLNRLFQDPNIANEIEKILAHYGFLTGSSFGCQYISKVVDDFNHGSFIIRLKRPSGFRVLISGSPKCGQGHLASCLLQGFIGNIAIQKISLTTISQEGDGDLDRGVSQILLKCLGLKQCVLFMPRIDLWAIDQTYQSVGNEIDNSLEKCSLDTTRRSSLAWDSFVQQMNTICSSTLIIVGTSDAQISDLPYRVRDFFHQSTSKSSTSEEYSIPRFSVQLDDKFDHKLLIDLSAMRLSQDLVQRYTQKVHHVTHSSRVHGGHEVHCTPIADLQGVDKSSKVTNTNELICKQKVPTRPISGEAIQTGNNCDLRLSYKHVSCNDFPSKGGLKGNLMLAISSFGYQVLRYPHFAELCWVTSKLQEGPVAEITGPLKFWPFNSCVLQANNSLGKIVAGSNVNYLKDKKNPAVVRGLIAVGLMAYRGVYTSALEISSDVRNVLELLVQEIDKKVSMGKDRLYFLRVLSQVAYLEDLINNWVYTLQRSHLESSSAGKSMPTKQNNLANNIEEQGRDEDIVYAKMEENKEYTQKQGALASNKCSTNESNLLSEVSVAQVITPGLNSNSPRDLLMEGACDGINQETGTPGTTFTCSCAGPCDCHSAAPNNICPEELMKDMPNCISNKSCYNSIDSDIQCAYDCCAECMYMLNDLIQKIFTENCESKRCLSSVDEMNDVISSRSATILAASVTSWNTHTTSISKQETPKNIRDHNCSSQIVDHVLLTKRDSQVKTSSQKQLYAECRCHLSDTDATATPKKSKISSLNPALKIFFRNNTIVPSNCFLDNKLHCNVFKLCLCPVIDVVLAVTRTSS